MCNCLTEMNARLEPHGACIATGMGISDDLSRMDTVILIGVERIGKGRKALPNVIASFCPFCGKKRGKAISKASANSA